MSQAHAPEPKELEAARPTTAEGVKFCEELLGVAGVLVLFSSLGMFALTQNLTLVLAVPVCTLCFLWASATYSMYNQRSGVNTLASASYKRLDFINTAFSLANAAAMSTVFVVAFAAGLSSAGTDLTDWLARFTLGIRPWVEGVLRMLLGYLVYDLIDLKVKGMLSPFLFNHHAATLVMTVVSLYSGHAVFILSSFIVGLAEFNSVFLHLRRLIRLSPSLADATSLHASVDAAFWYTHCAFRLCSPLLFLIRSVFVYIGWGIGMFSAPGLHDVILDAAFLFFFSHNIRLTQKLRQRTKSAKQH